MRYYDNFTALPPGAKVEYLTTGETLRDSFAMAALIGLQLSDLSSSLDFEAVARKVYGIADAMLVERAKGQR